MRYGVVCPKIILLHEIFLTRNIRDLRYVGDIDRVGGLRGTLPVLHTPTHLSGFNPKYLLPQMKSLAIGYVEYTKRKVITMYVMF